MSRIYRWPAERECPELLRRLTPSDDGLPESVVRAVRDIIAEVRERGDLALIDFTEQFDHVRLTPDRLRVTEDEIAASADRADGPLRDAIAMAVDNVRRFHEPQRRDGYELAAPGGGSLELLWRPVRSAALYIPGGRAAYPTSVIMNAVPALVAGVGRIAAFTVPGTVEENPAVACALQLLGIDEVWRVAGAQAIAAAALGTKRIRPVDMIVGPGNAYVAAAKREVFGRVGIDAVAGPSEVLILADDSANPVWVAHDLIAQAEHDPLARCVLASTSHELLATVCAELKRLVPENPRHEIIAAALRDHAAFVHAHEADDLVELCNLMAPEHLQVILRDPPAADELVAGAIFIGPWAPTALGDYIAGPNHVLPTGGTSRFSGPLGVHTFLRPTSVVRGTREMAAALAPPGARIADQERLPGHAAALRARLEDA